MFPPPTSLGPLSSGSSSGSTMVKNASDATEIGSSGDITDGADNVINLTLPDGTAAAVFGDGLSGLYGAAVWSLGGTLAGPLCAYLEWSTRQSSTVLCVGFLRASSAPTTLADLEADSVWLQLNTKSTGLMNPFHREEAETLVALHTSSANMADCSDVAYNVAVGPNSFEQRHHIIWNEDEDEQHDGSDSSVVSAASGFYLFVAYGAGATVSGGDKTLSVKLKGGFPV